MANDKIRVLHIDAEFSWRGGQQQVVYLLEGLLNRGYTTKIICQPNSEFHTYCKRKNLPVHPVRMVNELDIVAGFRIAAITRKEKFNVIYAHSAHALSIGLWTKLWNPPLKLIALRRVDFHLQHNILSHVKYRTRLVNKIICISDGIKKVLLTDGIAENKLITIHSGIDPHKFDSVKPYKDFHSAFDIPEDHLIVGTVAALAKHKDYPTLLQAARIVLDQEKKVTFVALGTGREEQKIMERANHLNLRDHFKFLGFRKNVGAILKRFDLFVMASKWEGLGTSILDAQSIGLPVIATNTGGIPEIVRDDLSGILVPPKNPEKLAESIIHLMHDRALRDKLSRCAISEVKRFSIERVIDKNIELLRALSV